MGAWGVGMFDDDSALDFLGELAEVDDPASLMRQSFVVATDRDYLEYDSAQSVVVSAAAIDTLLNGTHHRDDHTHFTLGFAAWSLVSQSNPIARIAITHRHR